MAFAVGFPYVAEIDLFAIDSITGETTVAATRVPVGPNEVACCVWTAKV